MGGVAGAHVASDGTTAEAQLLQNQTELSERFSFNRRLSSVHEGLHRGPNKKKGGTVAVTGVLLSSTLQLSLHSFPVKCCFWGLLHVL